LWRWWLQWRCRCPSCRFCSDAAVKELMNWMHQQNSAAEVLQLPLLQGVQ
jgi:hypothetical protein